MADPVPSLRGTVHVRVLGGRGLGGLYEGGLLLDTTLLDTVVVLAPVTALLSVLVRVSVAIFFTLIIVACKVSKFPVASKAFVASVVTFPST